MRKGRMMQQMLGVFYNLELYFLCIIALLIVLKRSGGGLHRESRWQIFTLLIRVSILFCIVSAVTDGQEAAGHYRYHVYLRAASCIAYLGTWYVWTLLCIISTKKEQLKRKIDYLREAVPLLAAAGIDLVSIRTGWTLQDAADPVQRTYISLIHPAVLSAYIILMYIRMFRIRGAEEIADKRRLNRLLMDYAGIAYAGYVLRLLWPVTDGELIGIALGVIWIYMGMVTQMISLDTLTHLNNRQNLISFIEAKMRMHRDRLFILMADVNFFKQINDKYGHVVGDEALVRVAESLKAAAGKLKTRAFIARYGGDEFIMVFESETETEAVLLEQEIKKELSFRDGIAQHAKELTVSVGTAEFDASVMPHPRDFIDAADQELYRNKMAGRSAQQHNP